MLQRDDIHELWKSLRYPVAELLDIAEASDDEIIACWLLNSQVSTSCFTDLGSYQKQVENRILAIDSDDLEIKKLFSLVGNTQLVRTTEYHPLEHPVSFLVEREGITFEWLSVALAGGSINLILDNRTLVQLDGARE
ncbi:MAG: hypothetical protein AAGJ86_01965 [Pseudomonadota bacterium]